MSGAKEQSPAFRKMCKSSAELPECSKKFQHVEVSLGRLEHNCPVLLGPRSQKMLMMPPKLTIAKVLLIPP